MKYKEIFSFIIIGAFSFTITITIYFLFLKKDNNKNIDNIAFNKINIEKNQDTVLMIEESEIQQLLWQANDNVKNDTFDDSILNQLISFSTSKSLNDKYKLEIDDLIIKLNEIKSRTNNNENSINEQTEDFEMAITSAKECIKSKKFDKNIYEKLISFKGENSTLKFEQFEILKSILSELEDLKNSDKETISAINPRRQHQSDKLFNEINIYINNKKYNKEKNKNFIKELYNIENKINRNQIAKYRNLLNEIYFNYYYTEISNNIKTYNKRKEAKDDLEWIFNKDNIESKYLNSEQREQLQQLKKTGNKEKARENKTPVKVVNETNVGTKVYTEESKPKDTTLNKPVENKEQESKPNDSTNKKS